MGLVLEEITLKNIFDEKDCKRGLISETQIRQMTTKAMVDTGAETLVINEAMRQELGLDVEGELRVSLANESGETCNITEPVMIYWKDRSAVAKAVVLPGLEKVLLGALPLEEMNVIVDPLKQQLVGAHGDQVILRV